MIKIEFEVDPIAYGPMNVGGKMLTLDEMTMKDLLEFVVESLDGGTDLFDMVNNVKVTRASETVVQKLTT